MITKVKIHPVKSRFAGISPKAKLFNRVNKKVVVGMSGGVDSSVAAALLTRANFHVVGVFMKFWAGPDTDGSAGRWNRCCSPEAEERARKVAQILDIPFYVLNFKKEFKKRIVDYFLKEYKAGRTPNPCVVCNKEIKFGLFLEKALALKADFIATGHYARLRKGKLLKASDKNKDQSYFLWQLSQKQIKRVLFPVGDYTKSQVRAMAKKFNLPVHNVKESQEICFVKNTVKDFLKKYLKEKPGKIVDMDGKIIGRHQGLWFYTIGQRKGIELAGGLATPKPRRGGGGPFYVVDKDLKKNHLIVSDRKKDLMKKELIAKDVNWLSGKSPKFPLKVKTKIRYGYLHPATTAQIHKIGASKKYEVVFSRAQRAITPGQSVVFYQGQELLGGGIISE